MTRHGRNSTANPVYTYHERKAASARSGYGSLKARLGKDSIKEFDCCCLTLQPCKDPVITVEGYLYDREAILENLLHQKKEISKKTREFEKQKEKLDAEEELVRNAEEIARKKQFLATERQITTKRVNAVLPASSSGAVSSEGASSSSTAGSTTVGAGATRVAAVAAAVGATASGGDAEGGKKPVPMHSAENPSFWVPALTPQAKPTLIKKPDKHPICPMSGRTLKLKDLITVRFTRINDDDARPDVAKKVRFRCAISGDELGNHVPCAVLRKSGIVVTMECMDKIVRKDMTDPTTGDKLEERDIIRVKGGTGFASSAADEGHELSVKAARPVAMF